MSIQDISDAEAIIAFALRRKGLNLYQISQAIGCNPIFLGEVMASKKAFSVPPDFTPEAIEQETMRLFYSFNLAVPLLNKEKPKGKKAVPIFVTAPPPLRSKPVVDVGPAISPPTHEQLMGGKARVAHRPIGEAA